MQSKIAGEIGGEKEDKSHRWLGKLLGYTSAFITIFVLFMLVTILR